MGGGSNDESRSFAATVATGQSQETIDTFDEDSYCTKMLTMSKQYSIAEEKLLDLALAKVAERRAALKEKAEREAKRTEEKAEREAQRSEERLEKEKNVHTSLRSPNWEPRVPPAVAHPRVGVGPARWLLLCRNTRMMASSRSTLTSALSRVLSLPVMALS